jgi:two-component system response regulator HydG
VLFRRCEGGAEPLLGVVADSGQLTRLAVANGAHFLLALSAGAYRQQGVTAQAVFLPHKNSNDLTEALLHEAVLPAAGSAPVIAGLLAADPTCPVEQRFERLKHWGVMGVTNYPSVTLLDGALRAIFEEEGCTVEAEIEMLQRAREHGFSTVGFVGAVPEMARAFAGAGVEALILTVGLTREWEVAERRDRLQQAIAQFNAGTSAARTGRPNLSCLAFGGPITTPDDLAQLLRQSELDGFVGGSVFGRLPVEASVAATVRGFKSVTVARGGGPTGLGPMLGATEVMRRLFQLIGRAAESDLNVCIEGESGVGKELVATHIHRLSSRAQGPLVTLNCGAIPDALLESELFGHEKGAFTGADHRRLGKFELADHGTLFLDEVGDLSARGQVALLRAIQQQQITRVGGNVAVQVDNRILSASNQPLARLVEQGRFRADLYYRLNNLTLVVPALRERPDDIPLLVGPILSALRLRMNRELTDLSPSFYDKLRRHAWPGNVRELQHVLAQAALLEDGPVLLGRHFTPAASVGAAMPDVESARRERVRQALREAGGNKSRAAQRLGVSRKTLYAWMREADGEGAG